jgi:hypothetical protein
LAGDQSPYISYHLVGRRETRIVSVDVSVVWQYDVGDEKRAGANELRAGGWEGREWKELWIER